MREDPDEGVVAYTTSQDAGARVEDTFWFCVGRRVQTDVLLVVSDVVDEFGIAFGAGEVLVVVDVHLFVLFSDHFWGVWVGCCGLTSQRTLGSWATTP